MRLAAPVTTATLNCHDVIGTASMPGSGNSVVLSRVALPTQRVLEASPSGEASPSAKLFAKWGLLIKPGVSFELVVPDPWVGHLTIGWGNPAKRVSRLVVRSCPAPTAGTHWLAFAGGYWVGKPACVPLTVKAGKQRRMVRIAVGKSCPAS